MITAVTRRETEQLCDDLGVLAEPHRLLVLRHLRRGARSAGFLAQAVGMPPSLASHHLSVLVAAGFITRRRKGHFVCYAANREAVKDLYQRMGRLAGATGAAVEATQALVDDPLLMDDLDTRIRAVIALHLEVDPASLGPESRLSEDLCVDSLTAVELAMVLEDELDVWLPEEVVAGVRTYGDMLAVVGERAGR